MKKWMEQFNLTAREKKMLYFLLCFLLIMVGWFYVITPLLDKETALNSQYQDSLNENSNKQISLIEYLNAPTKLAKLESDMALLLEKYNPEMTNEEIDRMLTGLFLRNKLSPTSLNIGSASPLSFSEENTSGTTLLQVSVRVSLSGTFNQFKDTIDQINALKGVEVVEFGYSQSSDSKSIPTCSMTIVVYMYK